MYFIYIILGGSVLVNSRAVIMKCVAVIFCEISCLQLSTSAIRVLVNNNEIHEVSSHSLHSHG